MSDGLEPLSPQQGVEMYLSARQDELSDNTLPSHKYRLEALVQWCEEEGIENLNDLSGRDLYAFRVWRREGHGDGRDPVEAITLRGQLATVRAFLRFCGNVNAVPEALFDKVPLPTLSKGESVSKSTLAPARATTILDYLGQYHYASRKHVIILLLWHTGARLGGVRGLDLRDCDLDDDQPGLQFTHRPETDTPLKNGENGERWNAISLHVAQVVQDYIDGPRQDKLDEHGRKPLITTVNGRPSDTTIRYTLYANTRPCMIGEGCPHDRDMEECEAIERTQASKCPSSRSPHDVRSGRVTAYRRADVPRRVVADRLNASEGILDKHYDRRSEREKADQRRDYLPDL